jgi:pimeloyl-ACP methyl ester carboxylesterase
VDQQIAVGPDVDLRVITWDPEGSRPSRSPGPVLVVHGLASNAHLWDGVADRLAARGHPVAAVDQRGHGQSTKPDTGYDFATLTDDLLALLAHLNWRPPYRRPWVAGQSWGANVVLELGRRHPDAIAGLVLVDGGIGDMADRFADWPTCEAALAPPPLDGVRSEDFERHLRSQHPDWPESGIAGSLANVEVRVDGTIRPWLKRRHHMTILRQLWEHRPSGLYPDLAVPVVLVPAEDPQNARWMAAKREDADRAVKAIPRSVTRWIRGDHDLHAQHPDLVAELIDGATDGTLFST